LLPTIVSVAIFASHVLRGKSFTSGQRLAKGRWLCDGKMDGGWQGFWRSDAKPRQWLKRFDLG
jgi:hypothetical protein